MEDVLELAVRGFGAEPLRHREADWEQKLEESRRRFEQWKTW